MLWLRLLVELCPAGKKDAAQAVLEELGKPTRAVLDALDNLKRQALAAGGRASTPDAVAPFMKSALNQV